MSRSQSNKRKQCRDVRNPPVALRAGWNCTGSVSVCQVLCVRQNGVDRNRQAAHAIAQWNDDCTVSVMANAIAGFFVTQAAGEQAKEALYQAGFSRDQVSFLAGDTRGHETPKIGPALQEEGTESELGTDTFIGGAVGLAAGVIALAIPGIGPLLAAGPITAAIGGMTAGIAAGGIVGLLKDHGISEEEAEFYAEGVRRGGALVTVHAVEGDREKAARKILKDNGAIEVEELAEEWRRTGWAGPQPKTYRAG